MGVVNQYKRRSGRIYINRILPFAYYATMKIDEDQEDNSYNREGAGVMESDQF